MAYELEAFLGPSAQLRTWRARLPSAVVCALTPEVGLVPLTGELIGDLQRVFPEAERTALAAAWGAASSGKGVVVLVQAEYFGNAGGQEATVWIDGRRRDVNVAINVALKRLGVRSERGRDEFDTVGLGRYRKTEHWAAEALLDQLILDRGDELSALVAAMSHAEDEVRRRAAMRLCGWGAAADQVAPVLLDVARTDGDYGVRLEATCTLATMGPAGLTALTSLLAPDALEDRWPPVFALGRMGDQAAPAVTALAAVLERDADWRVRREAAETLGKIGSRAPVAVDGLTLALDDEDRFVRSAAEEALAKIRE